MDPVKQEKAVVRSHLMLEEETRECCSRIYEEHRLVTLCKSEKVNCFQLERPATRSYSAQFTFTPEGIAIQGDTYIGPRGRGVCSSYGYTLDWFAREHEPYYLAEKFLDTGFCPDVASGALSAWLRSNPEMSDELRAEVQELQEKLNRSFFNDYETRQLFAAKIQENPEFRAEFISDVPGTGCHRWGEVITLAALQRAFIREYRKQGKWE